MKFFLLLVCCIQLVFVASEGISHSSHLMLVAAENGDTKTVIDYITVTGVPMTVKNNFGVSAILFAANNGHLSLLKALVDIGANIEDRSNNWKTPLNWAATWGHFACVKYLVSVGANISTHDAKGLTPLMAATQKGSLEIVEFLLNNGANPLTKNIFNGTALSIARIQNNTMLISLLEPLYPPDEETSPYVIAFNLIKLEVMKLSKVLLQEATRVWIDAISHIEVVSQMIQLRYKQYQEQRGADNGEYAFPCATGNCADEQVVKKYEHESDEF